MGSRAQILLEKEMSWVEVNLPFDDAAEEASRRRTREAGLSVSPRRSGGLPDAPGGSGGSDGGRDTGGSPAPSRPPSGRRPEAFLPCKLLRWKTDKKQHISLN